LNTQKCEFPSVCATGELAHALAVLVSTVSQSFIAFSDILELHKKLLELSGGINRIFKLEDFLHAAQRSKSIGSDLNNITIMLIVFYLKFYMEKQQQTTTT
jgi:hypothetical protein